MERACQQYKRRFTTVGSSSILQVSQQLQRKHGNRVTAELRLPCFLTSLHPHLRFSLISTSRAKFDTQQVYIDGEEKK